MALEAIEKTIRIDIPYFEGVNGAVSYVLAKKTEFAHMENARSKTVGSIEKREGQSVTGTTVGGGTFITIANYRLAYFPNTSSSSLYRVSIGTSSTLNISVSDYLFAIDAPSFERDVIVNGSFTGSAAGWDLGDEWSYSGNKINYSVSAVTTDIFYCDLVSPGYSPAPGTAAAGVGYTVGDIISFPTKGNGDLQVIITAVDGTGMITGIGSYNRGTGYPVSNIFSPVNALGPSSGGTGTGFDPDALLFPWAYTYGSGLRQQIPTHVGDMVRIEGDFTWSVGNPWVEVWQGDFYETSKDAGYGFFSPGTGIQLLPFEALMENTTLRLVPIGQPGTGSLDNIKVYLSNVSGTLRIALRDTVTVGESVFDGLPQTAAIYHLEPTQQEWTQLSGDGQGITTAKFDHVVAEGSLFLANGYAKNRYVKKDGRTVVTSDSGTGHLYNSPPAKKISYYKNRIYLANFYKDFNWYPTTIVRSSFSMGIISLVNEDIDTGSPKTIPVTDNKYFYSQSGVNLYEVYRGPNKVADLTVSAVNEYSIDAAISYISGYGSLDASDEIWVNGTYTGEKIHCWPNNPAATGKDIKLYDTMKLSGADNDEITMMIPVGDSLMIGNKNSLSVWNDYILQSIDMAVGCVSQEGYVKNYGALYFIHYTGIYTTTGGSPTAISQKVQRYIDGATKNGLEHASAGKKGRSVFFQIGDVTLYNPDGSVDKVMTNVCLEYNINQSNWFVHTGVPAEQFETYRDDSDYDQLQILSTDTNRSVRKFLDPATTTDVGTHIPLRIDTTDLTMQKEFENVSHPVAVMVEADRGSQMEAFVRIDREQYYRIDGAVKKGVSLLRINNRDGRRGKPAPGHMISVSLRDASDQICKINRMSIVHIPTLANADTDQ